MSGQTSNWNFPYATSGDVSTPNLWDQSKNLADRMEAVMNNGDADRWQTVPLDAGYTAPSDMYVLAVRQITGVIELFGGVHVTTPATLTNAKIATLPQGTLTDGWYPGAVALIGGTWQQCSVHIAFSELRVTTPGVASRINFSMYFRQN